MTRPGDLGSTEFGWEVALGTIPGLAAFSGSSKWGSVNLGGAVVTAGGLVFIGAARDDYVRAFDVETGRELAKWKLPAGGQATPMTYRGRNGKHFVVICAGGHGKMGTKIGDYVVAFALP